MSAPLPRYEDYVSGAADTGPVAGDEASWQRLHSRMIWVDAIQSLLSLVPVGLAVWVFRLDLGAGGLWPVIAIAAFGLIGAAGDAHRWLFTRYRVTGEYVERRTGVFVRSYRSVRRDRIRSVDIEARLRHRLAGLRVVKVGAGQQSAAGESALVLDAVLKQDAEELRRILRGHPPGRVAASPGEQPVAGPPGRMGDAGPADVQVFARLRPQWVVYNMFNVWAYVLALGLLWGGYWLALMFNFNPAGGVEDIVKALGWGWSIVIGVFALGSVGVAGMAINFFIENWNFELARVSGENGTLLRTRRGLFKTREVSRDDNRMRGVEISEPLLWRWMGMADTAVITTGLAVSSMSQPTAILPRGPVSVARPVAAAVLDAGYNPLEAALEPHPRAALRRRLGWATMAAAAAVGLLGWLAATDVLPAAAILAGVALWPLTLGAAVIAYRALGHAISGKYVVIRSGLMDRSTVALERPAVSTIAIRESLLQRMLGLRSVSAMTAAGYGAYEVPDIDAREAVRFAAEAAPGLLDPFLVTGGDESLRA